MFEFLAFPSVQTCDSPLPRCRPETLRARSRPAPATALPRVSCRGSHLQSRLQAPPPKGKPSTLATVVPGSSAEATVQEKEGAGTTLSPAPGRWDSGTSSLPLQCDIPQCGSDFASSGPGGCGEAGLWVVPKVHRVLREGVWKGHTSPDHPHSPCTDSAGPPLSSSDQGRPLRGARPHLSPSTSDTPGHC